MPEDTRPHKFSRKVNHPERNLLPEQKPRILPPDRRTETSSEEVEAIEDAMDIALGCEDEAWNRRRRGRKAA
jgi:hypothetical protein